MKELNEIEYLRYIRQISVPAIDVVGQIKLKKTSVLCIGAGGIGSPVLLYLAASGIGKIGVIDNDTIELSNLHRQILFNEADCSKSKALIAKKKITAQNSFIEVDAYPWRIEEENAHDLIAKYDIIIDGSDNFKTRYLVNDVCFNEKKLLISASIETFSGQLAIFDFLNDSPCYRCLYPQLPSQNLIPNCSAAGVLSTIPGLLGTIAATEIIKIILDIGTRSNLLVVNALDNQFQKYNFSKKANCVLCSSEIDTKALKSVKDPQCSEKSCADKLSLNAITAEELTILIKKNKAVRILDVRSLKEREIAQLPSSIHLPLENLNNENLPFAKNEHIIIYCRGGNRSQKAVKILQEKGFSNVHSLTGGILMWLNHKWLETSTNINY